MPRRPGRAPPSGRSPRGSPGGGASTWPRSRGRRSRRTAAPRPPAGSRSTPAGLRRASAGSRAWTGAGGRALRPLLQQLALYDGGRIVVWVTVVVGPGGRRFRILVVGSNPGGVRRREKIEAPALRLR